VHHAGDGVRPAGRARHGAGASGSAGLSADSAALTGRVVLVTGGTRGLGRGIADAYRTAGAHVVVCGRTPPDDPDVDFVGCDVRDAGSVAELVRDVVVRHGRLDVVVNNAGGSPSAPAATVSPRFVEKVVGLNLLAPFYVAQAANAVMQDSPEGGVILNIGSVAALRPAPGTSAYAAAKAGLAVLTRGLALEWAPKVRVNTVSPGLVRTETADVTYGEDTSVVEATIPMGRLAEPADIAAACLFLSRPGASFITGADLVVDGGGEVPAFHAALSNQGVPVA
jgi:NAD(P)-dependent dehydrogenase (short-subunit alcohol dehydrogenase family)